MIKKIIVILVILAVIFGIGYLIKNVQQPKEQVAQKSVSQTNQELDIKTPKNETSLESLARCLKEKGAKFYGTSWCGYCTRQKEIFGEAAKYLPYVECAGDQNQLAEECQKADIEAFPTWVINGEKKPGYETPEKLAEMSGCSMK